MLHQLYVGESGLWCPQKCKYCHQGLLIGHQAGTVTCQLMEQRSHRLACCAAVAAAAPSAAGATAAAVAGATAAAGTAPSEFAAAAVPFDSFSAASHSCDISGLS